MGSIIYYDVLALLGYAIVLNEEMHSRQIKLLNELINCNDWIDSKEIIYDVLNDKDEKIDENLALSILSKECNETQKMIYIACYQLILVGNESFADNEISSTEIEFLKKIESSITVDRLIKEKRKAQRELWDNKNKLFVIGKKNDFSIDLDSLKHVADADFNNYSHTIKMLASESDLLDKKLSDMQRSITNPQLRLALAAFKDEYRNKVFNAVTKMKESISTKELASKGFSLALMGRTKAGKSTLHSIMCQEGEEFIGKGCQRTTRFNRVFSWNGLKIIDTPGIGAGEDEGKRDTEIAERVIGQADIICFVVVDDSILEEIQSALDNILCHKNFGVHY